ncbi:hypothetical protein ACSSNL_09610 [Thalassobius sp. S69A]|uniref:hypothetical protein n=1 Tax=unclassified Thalassovita TaxID=2619711 RepID=UPI000C6C140B|nr:hypothetical protein [Paracoccaceae bacterium]
MRVLVLSVVCAGLLAGCGNTSNKQRIAFDGYYFKTSIQHLKDDPRMFDVTVHDAAQSREGAEDAGRYEATRHCVVNYGNSKLEWLVVRETDDRDVVLDDDTLLLRGRCQA